MKVLFMKICLAVVTLFFFILCTIEIAFANEDQDIQKKYTPFIVFGGASLNGNIYQSKFKQLTGVENCCTEFTNAFGIATNFFGGIEYKLTQGLLGDESRVGLVISYSNLSANFIEEKFIGNYISGDIVKKEIVEYQINPSVTAAMAGLYYSLYPVNNLPLVISAGVKYGLYLNQSYEQKEILLQPKEAVFENGTKERAFRSGEIPNASSNYFGINIGISYEVFKFTDFVLRPQIEYTHSFTDVASSLDWKAHTLSAGFALLWNIPEKQIPPVSPPLSPPLPLLPEPPEQAQLSLAFSIVYGATKHKSGDTIAFEYSKTDYFNLLSVRPKVFFKKNDATIKFTEKYTSDNYEDTQKYAINSILGYLAETPNETVTISSYILDDENEDIAKQRVENVKNELSKKTISNENIIISIIDMRNSKFRYEELKDEYRVVSFSFDKTGEIISISKKSDSSVIRINQVIGVIPAVIVEAKPFDMKYDISINGKIIKQNQTRQCKIELENEIVDVEKPSEIEITGTLEDATGKVIKKIASFTLTPSLKNIDSLYLINVAPNKPLILGYFNFDESVLKSSNQSVLKIVRKALEDGKKVTMIPLHDNFGTEEYNLTLLKKRAAEAIKLFGDLSDKIIIKMPKKYYFSNDLPATRLMNRSVLVFIE